MSDALIPTLELPGALYRAALEALIPSLDAATELPREFVRMLAEEIEANDVSCDHSVGICACGEAATLAELKLRLDGMMTCPECGGEGFTWDERVYVLRIKGYVSLHGGSEAEARGALGDDGYATCPRCKGKCVVAVEEEHVDG